MGENELYQIAFHFREAIVAAKTNGEFNFRDRMHRFPGGCCDDTCDLLGFYLWEKYRIHTSQRNGYYEAEMTNHAWLITDARIILISREISSMEHGNQFMLDRKLELTKN